jgi:hypothetical protein
VKAPEPVKPAEPKPAPPAVVPAPPKPPAPPAPKPPAPVAAAPAPPAAPAPSDGRKAEIEALTTEALEAFVSNKYAKARKAVDKALSLDPNNKKAKELQKILGALG